MGRYCELSVLITIRAKTRTAYAARINFIRVDKKDHEPMRGSTFCMQVPLLRRIIVSDSTSLEKKDGFSLLVRPLTPDTDVFVKILS